MNKKGFLGVDVLSIDMITLVIFLLVLIAVMLSISRCSLMRSQGIDESQRNGLDILVAQVNALRVENGEKVFASKIDGNFQIDVYGKCKEKKSIKCSVKPKICLVNTKNNEISPYCREIQGTDLVSATGIRISNDIKMEKTKEDGEEITRIYS